MPTWEKTYGTNQGDYGRSVLQTADGGFIFVGRSDHGAGGIWLVRTDPLGDTLWTKMRAPFASPRCAVLTASGGVVIAGNLYTLNDTTRAFVLCTDSVGDSVWTRTYFAGPGRSYGTAICRAGHNGYLIVGQQLVGPKCHALIVRTDSVGQTLWTRVYQANDDDVEDPKAVASCADGGFIIAGSFRPPSTISQGLAIRIDEQGDSLWLRKYGSGGLNGNWFSSVVATPGGSFMGAGSTDSYGAGGIDFWLVRFASDGSMQRMSTYGGPGEDRCFGMVPTSDGGFALCGQTHSFGHGWCDAYLVGVDSGGDTAWSRTFGGSDWDDALGIASSMDSGLVLVGSTFSFGNGAGDIYAIKTDSLGLVAIAEKPRGAGRVIPPLLRIAAGTPSPSGGPIQFHLPTGSAITLDLFDCSGRRVALLAQGKRASGWHRVSLPQELRPGSYFVRLSTPESSATAKLVLLEN
jgi:hypothetical protein